MIHSDLRTANLLKDGDRIGVLDFDDCGKGWYMYEIAGAVALIEHRADLKEIIAEILKGYESILPVSKEDKDEIWTFIMMRRIGMLQSLISRIGCVMPGEGEAAELTPEILAFYAKGTVVLAKDYIKKYELKALPITSAVYKSAEIA
jgi:Ser/Thr protein kinase RdoA (MazF antagonist)